MEKLKEVDLDIVQRHEKTTNSNIRIGGYNMPESHEFKCFRVLLEEDDISRIILPNDYGKYTAKGNCFLKDVQSNIDDDERTASFLKLDLREDCTLAVVIVTNDHNNGPLFVCDGGHRLCSQFRLFKTVANIAAFVGVHTKIKDWASDNNFKSGLAHWKTRSTGML